MALSLATPPGAYRGQVGAAILASWECVGTTSLCVDCEGGVEVVDDDILGVERVPLLVTKMDGNPGFA